MAKKRLGLWGSIRGLFRDEQTREAQKGSKPMKGEEDHWVPLSLDELLNHQPDLEVHLVTLRQFRAAVGDAWLRIEQKVILISESVLRKEAGFGAVLTRQGDEAFVLAFPRLTREQGRKKASDAVIELGRRLVGAKFSVTGGSGEEPAICMASAIASELTGDDGKIDQSKIAAVSEAAKPIGGTAGSGAMTPLSRPRGGQPGLSRIRKDGEPLPENRWIELHRQNERGEVRLVPMEQPKKKVSDPVWVPIKKQ